MTNTDYTFEELTADRAAWYGSPVACFIVRFKTSAPIKELASIVNGYYTDNEATGYIHGNGNTGTRSVLLTDLAILNTI